MDAKTESVTRRYDMDWLRVLAILSVFLFHSARFFNLDGWSIKNGVTYAWVQTALDFMMLWMMPLIFVISGAAAFYAIGKTGPGQFAKDKVLRLAVPVVVGAFTHASLQVYLERITHGQFEGSYWQFLPHYFDGLYTEGGTGNFAWHGMHLWYLVVLFGFSLLLMPLLYWLKGLQGGRALRKIGDFLALPGAILVLFVPTIVMQNTLNWGGLLDLGLGGWSLERYVWFFLAGFILISSERLVKRIGQMRWLTLALGLVLVLANLRPGADMNDNRDLTSWLWILAFLGFGFKYMTSRTPFLKYANEAVLPFYIMHQTVLIIVGYFVVEWPIPDVAKWLIIAASSLALIMGLYEFGVRRNNTLRILFGMKRLDHAAQPAGLSPVPHAAK